MTPIPRLASAMASSPRDRIHAKTNRNVQTERGREFRFQVGRWQDCRMARQKEHIIEVSASFNGIA